MKEPGLGAQVVKGCWQLSGAHHGDRDSDRTAGEAAVRDFAAFQAAGVTTLDVADHYGPGEELIGGFVHWSAADMYCALLSFACLHCTAPWVLAQLCIGRVSRQRVIGPCDR